MTIKRICLNVTSRNFPLKITIYSCCGQILRTETINSNSRRICFCTNRQCLRISAKYQNQIIHRTLILSNCCCQTIFLGFSFSTFQPQRVTTTITLQDANYGLPIPNAVLTFNSQ